MTDKNNTRKVGEILSPFWLERAEKGRKSIEAKEAQAARGSAEPIPISAARFPRELGMFPFSAPKKTRSLQYTSPKGDFRINIETSPSFDSIPTIEDEQVLYFIVSKAREIAPDTAHIPQKVYFKLSECLNWLGLDDGGRQYKFVVTALRRYGGANILTNRFNRRGREEEEVFSLFTYSTEKINKRDAYVVVVLCDALLRSLRAGQINALPKPIWEEFRKSRSPYRKIIIMKVNAYMARKTEQSFMQSTLMELCGYQGEWLKFRKLIKGWNLPWKYVIEKKGKDYKYTFFATADQSQELPLIF